MENPKFGKAPNTINSKSEPVWYHGDVRFAKEKSARIENNKKRGIMQFAIMS